MEIDEFIANFAEQFDDTDSSEITKDCCFRELDEYSSLIGMSIIALARTEYGKVITGSEIRTCTTVEDLYMLIKNK